MAETKVGVCLGCGQPLPPDRFAPNPHRRTTTRHAAIYTSATWRRSQSAARSFRGGVGAPYRVRVPETGCESYMLITEPSTS